jgi:hypothetical protein
MAILEHTTELKTIEKADGYVNEASLVFHVGCKL